MAKHIKRIISILAPLVVLILAYLLDLAVMSVSEETGRTLTVYPYRFAYMALIALFALGIVAYVWFLAAVPEAQPWNGIISLTISLSFLLYPHLPYLISGFTLPSLPPFLRTLRAIVGFGSPRAYTVIAVNVVAVGAVFSLRRYYRNAKLRDKTTN